MEPVIELSRGINKSTGVNTKSKRAQTVLNFDQTLHLYTTKIQKEKLCSKCYHAYIIVYLFSLI